MEESGVDPIEEIAAALYALEPDEFVPARDARAATLRAGGDRALAARVKALRKPSVAAAAVNRLVRLRTDDVAGLLELGAALRQAQEELAGDDLRELTRQRQGAVAALTRAAAQVGADAGRPLTEAVTRQVEATLTAAMADPDAAAAVSSGLLTAHLEYAGFGFGELADVVALPVRRAGRRTEPVRDASDTARRAADEARAAAAAAARELAEAADRATAATRAHADAKGRVAALAAELDVARVTEEEAARAEADAVRARAVAERSAAAAERAAARADEALRELAAD